MKSLLMALGLVGAFSLRAEILTNGPAPKMEEFLPRVLERAKAEDENERTFKQRYTYERTKVTEFRNARGEVKKKKENSSLHVPDVTTSGAAVPVPPAKALVANDPDTSSQPASETHSNIKGRAFEKRDFPLTSELLARFEFSMVGQETLNGRRAWVVDFKPAQGKLPENGLKDRFINKAAGRVWVDAEDHAMAKAVLFLSEPVSVAGGLVGAVKKFTCDILRERTADGFWYIRDTSWHLEGREVFFRRIIDYHEERKAVHPFLP
jgi:hypothetical protein